MGSLDDLGLDDDDVLEGLVVGVGVDALDLVDDIHPLDDLSEDGVCVGGAGVLLVEVSVVVGVDEELASSGVGTAGVGHGNETGLVGVALAELIVDGVSGSAHTGTGGVSSLDHEVADDPVEDGVVIISGFCEFYKVSGGDGHILMHFDGDVSHVRVENDIGHAVPISN